MAEQNGAPIISLLGPDGEWLDGLAREKAISSSQAPGARLRACVSCPNVYHGELPCPACGEPGEPLSAGWAIPECLYCGSNEIREDVPTGAIDCVSCGEGQG